MQLAVICCLFSVNLVAGKLHLSLDADQNVRLICRLLASYDKLYNYNQFLTIFGKDSTVDATMLQQRLMAQFDRPHLIATAAPAVVALAELRQLWAVRKRAVLLLGSANSSMLSVLCSSHNMPAHTTLIVFLCRSGNPAEMLRLYNNCWEKCASVQILLIYAHAGVTFEVTAYRNYRSLQGDNIGAQLSSLNLTGLRYREQYLCPVRRSSSGITLRSLRNILSTEFTGYLHSSGSPVRLAKQELDYNSLLSTVSRTVGGSHKSCLLLAMRLPIPVTCSLTHFTKPSLLGLLLLQFTGNLLVKRLCHDQLSAVEILFRSLLLTIGQTAPGPVCNGLRLPEKFIAMSTHWYLQAFVGIWTSAMTQALSSGKVAPKIENAEQFRASGLRIMLHKNQMSLFRQQTGLPSALMDRLRLVNATTLRQHITQLNNSYAYVLESYVWPTLDYMQQRLGLARLQLASNNELCAMDNLANIPWPENLELQSALDAFYMRAFEAGLIQRWTGMAMEKRIAFSRLMRKVYKVPVMQPLYMDFFRSAIYLYAFGMLAGLICLLLELSLMWLGKQHS